jgi:hypothetical protein
MANEDYKHHKWRHSSPMALPGNLNPKPETRNPKPETRNPKP